MYFKRQSKAREDTGQFSEVQDADEFDKLILHISMQLMMTPNTEQKILMLSEIMDIF